MIVSMMLGAVLLAATSDCGASPNAGADSCGDRVGWCFDLTVDDQPVVPLHDPELRRRKAVLLQVERDKP